VESMADAFPVKPGKAQEWRDRGREFRRARRNEYLAFRRRWGLTVNRLYFQYRPQRDLAVFYLDGHDLQRAFQCLRTAQNPFAVWLPPEDALDDWQTSAWDEQFPSIHHTLKQVLRPPVNEIHSEASANDFPRRLDR
jgi:hypothetical protein